MQLFVDDLTVMDFSYLCPLRGMVGESWIVDVRLDGELNDESMIQDFSKVKKELKRLIDEHVDHKLLVPCDYSGVNVTRNSDSEQVDVHFTNEKQEVIYLSSPAEAYAFIYSDAITIDSVGDYLQQVIATHLPDNVDALTLLLRTEVINTPFYHYTHGLKKHDGNCQRIAHGHRSKIDVFYDGVANLQAQQTWADKWADIYVLTREDIVPIDAYLHLPGITAEDYLACSYESSQGVFHMVMHRNRIDVIDTDTTVECIAQYFYDVEKKQNPHYQICVKAYEGVGKGAMVSD